MGEVPEFLKRVVTQHVRVFQKQVGPPSIHGKEHRITLQENVSPVNVRPY